MSSTTIYRTEKISEKINFSYYLKWVRNKYNQHKVAIIVSRPNV